jgi:hypothetical protein
VSVSLRNERGKIYRYSNAGSEGLTDSRYTYDVERWCRFETPSGREQTLGAKADRQIDGKVAFADEVTIGINDLIVLYAVQYKVVAVNPRRASREILCDVVLGDEDPTSLVES